jgi:arylformamidase
MAVVDLTRLMDAGLAIYTEDGYSDPPFECAEWCSVASRGFRVSALRLGTQTGTHIDAPAHFDAGGATLDSLPVDRLIGRYFLVDLPEAAGAQAVAALCRSFTDERILFVRTPDAPPARLDAAGLDVLLGLPPRVWVVDGGIEIDGRPALEFHRLIAAAGVYLVEDLDRAAARTVRPDGEIAALPLALVGTSGAPCRVVVRQRAARMT